jgi:PAS domain S-box-containing protein
MQIEHLKILAIDDHQDNLTTLEAVVADTLPGARVFSALDGWRGLELARGQDPDVILLDIVMPGLDGFEVCRRLKSDEDLRHIPVVFLTALKTGRESRIQALEVGGEAFLAKPLDETELTAQIYAMAKIKKANARERQEKITLAALVAERTGELERELATRRQAEEGLMRANRELKRSQEALRASEQKYRGIYETIQDVYFETTLEGTLLEVSPSAERLSGFRRQELIGAPVRRFYTDPSQREAVFLNLLETGKIDDYEIDFTHKSGRVVPCSLSAILLADQDSLSWKACGVLRDISARKRGEQALRASEERLRGIFEQAAVGMSLLSPQGAWLQVNQRLCDILGYPRQELMRLTFRDITHPEDLPGDLERIQRMPSTDSGSQSWEKRYFRKDGQVIWVRLTSTTVRGEDGQVQYFVAVTEDITERKQAAQEKAALESQLRQAQKMEAIGTLAGGIAHDFNNILAAILGFAEMARDDAQAGRVDPADLDQIMRSAQRAKALVQQILVFSRKQEPQLKPLDLNQAVSHAWAILERTLPKMIDIETTLAPELSPILADPTQLEQVLLNLAANARDAMPEGGKLFIETSHAFLDHDYCRQHLEVRPGDHAVLTVSDTGQGMDDHTREHLFEPFFTTKEIGKGTGLGLSSVYGIIKNHGGHLHCYSEPGQGTVFKIYLPVFAERRAQASGQSPLAMEEAPGGNECILLVDDEEALRQYGARTLQFKGYRVLTAASGEEALELYRQQDGKPDLVILDLGMPGMGGHKTLKEMLALNPGVKVIIASGYSAAAQVKDSLEAGATGYVAKPFRRSELLGTVRKVLDGTGAPGGA